MINLVEWLRKNAGRVWHHKERGTDYIELGRGRLQNSTKAILLDDAYIVAYVGEGGHLCFREESEFEDGRFAEMDRTPMPEAMKLPDDLFSHREDFRSAIAANIDMAREYSDPKEETDANIAYWTHQLDVFDRISEFLDTLDVERVEMPKTDDLSKEAAVQELTGGEVDRVLTVPEFIAKVAPPIPVHAIGDPEPLPERRPALEPVPVPQADRVFVQQAKRRLEQKGPVSKVMAGALLRLIERQMEVLEMSGFADCYRAGYDAAITKTQRDSACDGKALVQ